MADGCDMSVWSHLPNAHHIDRVLASLKANPEAWDTTVRSAAWSAAWDAASDAALNTAWGAAWYAERDAALDAALDAAWGVIAARTGARTAAQDAILAPLAWDNCTHLLDSEPEEVRLLAALGVNSAILLYPACLAMSKEKELA